MAMGNSATGQLWIVQLPYGSLASSLTFRRPGSALVPFTPAWLLMMGMKASSVGARTIMANWATVAPPANPLRLMHLAEMATLTTLRPVGRSRALRSLATSSVGVSMMWASWVTVRTPAMTAVFTLGLLMEVRMT